MGGTWGDAGSWWGERRVCGWPRMDFTTSLWLDHLRSAGSHAQGCPTREWAMTGRCVELDTFSLMRAPVLAGLAGDREAGRKTMVSSPFSDSGRPVLQEWALQVRDGSTLTSTIPLQCSAHSRQDYVKNRDKTQDRWVG